MKRYFKTKRRIKLSFFFWIFLFIGSIYVCLITLDDISYSYYFDSIIKKNIKIDAKKFLNRMGFNHSFEEIVLPVFEEKIEVKNPSIYIYNTHQSEEYNDSDVYEASLMFKDLLSERGFEVLVEETNISEELKNNNYKYKDSYKITRELLSYQLDSDFDLYIDFHRDSSKRSVSTVTIDGISYARVMFVIGKNHSNYKYNYDLVSNLNKIIKNINNKLTRGIYVRESSAFNQDLDKNVILLEVGGPENTIEEVNNTLNILCDVFEYYFYE